MSSLKIINKAIKRFVYWGAESPERYIFYSPVSELTSDFSLSFSALSPSISDLSISISYSLSITLPSWEWSASKSAPLISCCFCKISTFIVDEDSTGFSHSSRLVSHDAFTNGDC